MESLKTLEMGINLIEYMARHFNGVTQAGASEALKIDKAAIRRQLDTLILKGWAEAKDGKYFLTNQVARIGYMYLETQHRKIQEMKKDIEGFEEIASSPAWRDSSQ